MHASVRLYSSDLIDQLFNSTEKRLARTLLLLARYGKNGISFLCRNAGLSTARLGRVKELPRSRAPMRKTTGEAEYERCALYCNRHTKQ
jgi:hypothetical protein